MHVSVNKAMGIGGDKTEDMVIVAKHEFPRDGSLDDARRRHEGQAKEIADALEASLPGGTLARLRVELMRRHVSDLVVLEDRRSARIKVAGTPPPPRKPRVEFTTVQGGSGYASYATMSARCLDCGKPVDVMLAELHKCKAAGGTPEKPGEEVDYEYCETPGGIRGRKRVSDAGSCGFSDCTVCRNGEDPPPGMICLNCGRPGKKALAGIKCAICEDGKNLSPGMICRKCGRRRVPGGIELPGRGVLVTPEPEDKPEQPADPRSWTAASGNATVLPPNFMLSMSDDTPESNPRPFFGTFDGKNRIGAPENRVSPEK